MNEALFNPVVPCCAQLDPQFRYIKVNAAYAGHFRMKAADFIGRNYFDFFSPDQTEASAIAIARLFDLVKTNQAFHATASPCTFADQPERGITYWDSTLQPVCDGHGKVEMVFFSSLEVTERVRNEANLRKLNAGLEQRVQERTQALAESEERSRLLFNAMAQGVVHQAATGRILFMNPAAERILGHTRTEFTGWSSADVEHHAIHEDGTPFPDIEHPSTVALRSGGEVRNVVMGIYHVRERARRWINLTAIPLFRSGEQAADEVCTIFDDITDRRAADLEIKRLHEQQGPGARATEAINKELDALCYAVSHDLRTPLRSVDGFSRVLLEDYSTRLDEDGRDSLRRIRAASQRMGLLIDDLLTLSRTARAELHCAPQDLTALAEHLAANFSRTEPDREVEWIIARGLAAHADGELLRRALQNLLSNAWKFTSRRPSARIEVGRTEAGSEPAFYVRDNGAGFEKENAHKLFRPFQRLHTTQEFPGTGIGLANVQRIVHRHGGRIWADGKIDGGATFYFTLPEQVPHHETSVC